MSNKILTNREKEVFELLILNKTTRDIAKELGYSACYISHTFKEKTGVTVKQYISKKKIHKGVELLETGKFSVTKVAQILNYSNVQSFSRTFKQIIGVYPSKYLKNLNSGLNL